MGWKIRKDKLQADQSDDMDSADSGDSEEAIDIRMEEGKQNEEPTMETDAGALARLARMASSDTEPSAFSLDANAFRTDTRRTTLDPSEFSWFNQNGSES